MMKRNPNGTINFSQLDDGLADEIRASQQRQAARSMSKAQRRAAARNKATYDLPAEVTQHLDALADELSVPVSQVARWMILRGIEHTTEDELRAARVTSRSMRYEFNLFPNEASPKGQP